MRIVFTLFFLFLLSLHGFGQKKYATESKKAIKYYEQAIAAFNTRNFALVQEHLDAALKKDAAFIDAYLLRAELFRINYRYPQQISDLQRVISINPSYFPYAYYNLAMAQWQMGMYAEAQANFEAFIALQLGKESSREKAREFSLKCAFAQQLVDNPVEFTPVSLGDSINTENDEYWPSLSIDGNTLYYSTLLLDSSQRTITGHYAHQEDFFSSKKVDGYWTKGKALGYPINTPGNEGAMKISADGTTAVFTACNRSDGYGRCDIYFSFKTATGWSNAVNAGSDINSPDSEKQPCLSADGNRLYFSSNRPGGLGEMDIWYADWDPQGFWAAPVNMGPVINTPLDEESPFLHPDNKTFYYSSDGHWGLGMKDIFYTRLNDSSQWQKPQNLGYPINTFQDEIGLFIDNTGENAFYSSNFNDSSRNIYQFILPLEARPLPVSYLSGTVFNSETHLPLAANIELLNTLTGEKIMEVWAQPEDGSFLICLPSGFKYALNVSCPGYLFSSVHFNLSGTHSFANPYNQHIGLHPVKTNESVVLENIFFESDSYKLKAESKAELQKIEAFIKNNSGWKFEIGGYTDQSGSQEYNMELSEKRAQTVYNYLISKDIDAKNLSFKGYGEAHPIAKNNNEVEPAASRRTELKIIAKVK